MAIPYLLIGDIQEAGTYLRKDANHFRNIKIELVAARADKVDTSNKKVFLNNGKSVSYDRLLIASGSKPVAPPIPGMNLPGIYPCWTLEDARHIAKLAKKGARVLQMGAGFIGCIILEALASRGVELIVVEMGNRMVPRMMTEGAGGLIKKWCEKKGVKVFTSTKVEAIEKSGNSANPLKVKLSNGESLTVSLVISATGVRPNIEFLKGTTGECNSAKCGRPGAHRCAQHGGQGHLLARDYGHQRAEYAGPHFLLLRAVDGRERGRAHRTGGRGKFPLHAPGIQGRYSRWRDQSGAHSARGGHPRSDPG
jgi:NADH dehydrogenase FAD-containing subunit